MKRKPQTIAQNERMLALYDRDKNNKDPSEIYVSNQIPVYWKCTNTCPGEEDCKHEWVAYAYTVNTARSKTGCPWCCHTKGPCCLSKSVAGNPRLLSLWCKERNGALGLYPENVQCTSGKKVWWTCDKVCNTECKHQWETTVMTVYEGSSCPFCAVAGVGAKICCIQKSAAGNPILSNSFDRDHPENSRINLELLRPHSAQKVWWICHNNCDAYCVHSWKASVAARHKYGCPFCSSKSLCCIKKSCANPKYADHMQDFDYELYYPRTPADFFPISTIKLLWKCYVCKCGWAEQIQTKLKNRSGCIDHRSTISNGESECQRILKTMNIPFKSQFKFLPTNRERYDLQFIYNNCNYILEFDGGQHFKPWRKESETQFQTRQYQDIQKTNAAISANYFIIRIDYKNINRIKQCLLNAFECQNQGAKFYLSSPDMYTYLNLI
jgi:very-short-patch-repair endonuclease